MTPAEVAQATLNRHYPGPSWAPRSWSGLMADSPRLGHWGCGCGAGGEVAPGEKVVDHHRGHVAGQLVAALARAGYLVDMTDNAPEAPETVDVPVETPAKDESTVEVDAAVDGEPAQPDALEVEVKEQPSA